MRRWGRRFLEVAFVMCYPQDSLRGQFPREIDNNVIIMYSTTHTKSNNSLHPFIFFPTSTDLSLIHGSCCVYVTVGGNGGVRSGGLSH